VRAADESGAVVFCRGLSYEEVKGNLSWEIEIIAGVNTCS
jgi:hypothetical protein